MVEPFLRLRCPKDTDPAHEAEHLAFDVRLPLRASLAGAFLQDAARCKCFCGAAMVLPLGPPAVATGAPR